jgi:hypothetical protein
MIPKEKTTQLALQYIKALEKSDVAKMKQVLELFEVHLFQYLPEDDIKEKYVHYFNSVHNFDKKLASSSINALLPETTTFILKHYLECAKLLSEREVLAAYKQNLHHEVLEFLSLIKNCLAISLSEAPDFRYDLEVSTLLLNFFKFIIAHADLINFTPVTDIHERAFERIERKFAKVPGALAEEIRHVLACINKIFYGQTTPTENFWVVHYGKLNPKEILLVQKQAGLASTPPSALSLKSSDSVMQSNSCKRKTQEMEGVVGASYSRKRMQQS